MSFTGRIQQWEGLQFAASESPGTVGGTGSVRPACPDGCFDVLWDRGSSCSAGWCRLGAVERKMPRVRRPSAPRADTPTCRHDLAHETLIAGVPALFQRSVYRWQLATTLDEVVRKTRQYGVFICC